MTVAEIIEKLQQFPSDLPVHLTWSHGAEPGPVSDISLVSYSGSTPWIEVRGEQPD